MGFIKQHIKYMAALLLGVVAMACSDVQSFETPVVTGPNEDNLVQAFVAVPASGTRTEIEEDGVTVRWSTDDKMALWATDGSSMPLVGQSFNFFHYSEEYPTAYFTSFIPEMAEANYTYYAFYPTPSSVSGTTVTYNLPAVQSGTKSLKDAVMIASAVQGGSLTGSANGDLHLDFHHKCHILKITIPESKNLLGEEIERLEITFPTEVTGTLTFDVTDPEAPVGISNGSKVLTLDFEEPVDAGDVVYAVVAPVDASAGIISFRGYSARRETELISTLGKEFREGHTTPIRLTIPTMRYMTRIYFSIGENFLGENPNSFTVTVNNGTFPDGSASKSFTINASNSYEYSYEGLFTDNFSGKTLTYTFDSNNAIVSNTQTAPAIEAYTRNTLPAQTVPYLYTEDFSTITSFTHNYKDGPHTSVSGASSTGYDLSSDGISGWTGARTGGEAGKSVLVAGRVDEVKVFGYGGATRAYGRLDSPAMSALKSGASVKLSVSFNYSFTQEDTSKTAYSPAAVFGTTTTSGVIKGYATQYVDEAQFSGIDQYSNIVKYDMNGSFSNVNHSATYTLSGCGPANRLSWHITVLGDNGISNDYHMLYIDNIKVSITN